MKIYTLTGDEGETGLPGGRRVSKDCARIETVGSIDELNAALGAVRAERPPPAIDRLVERIQHELLCFGAQVAASGTGEANVSSRYFHPIADEHVAALERAIDEFQTALPELQSFVLPAGTRAAAALHVARTTCRRAERRLVAWIRVESPDIDPTLKRYLNRLSDLLFVLARAANAAEGVPDVLWRKGRVES
ncbi:MAG: cob(I)yrinic acid a,c-diamide adenosyltransferase [Planctomycetota bacterium]